MRYGVPKSKYQIYACNKKLHSSELFDKPIEPVKASLRAKKEYDNISEYEKMRMNAIQDNLKCFFSEIQQKQSSQMSSGQTLSSICPANAIVSLIIVDDFELIEDEHKYLQIIKIYTEAIHLLPLHGYFIVRCKDFRKNVAKNDNVLVPAALKLWKLLEKTKHDTNSLQQKRSLFLKDLLMIAERGHEKKPTTKEFFFDLPDLESVSSEGATLPVVHEYFLIYQKK